jgi:hypothetical protein
MPYRALSHESRLQQARRSNADREYDTHRRVHDAIRHTSRWRRFRTWFLSRHPLCADPFGNHKRVGETIQAVQVHHLAGVHDRPDLGMDEDNCQAVCTTCHAQIEAGVRARGIGKSCRGEGGSNLCNLHG